MQTRNLPLCFALFATALVAQESRGTIAGRVVDSSGAVIAGATVRAANSQTGTVATAQTNDSGQYTIPYLLPGVYTLTSEISGFKKTERPNIEVRVSEALDVELKMEVGSAAESVQVTAGAPLLESEQVSLGQVIEKRRIDDLPLQAGNAQELVLLAPGVVNTTNLRARKTSFNSASSQFSTNGNALYSNETTIDGVPDTFASAGTPLVAFQPPQSAVSEFKVQTTAFDAGVGHTPGAVVNLITTGGTNDLHGELHEWFSNSALDAATFFQNRSGGRKPVYQDNRFGASLGGPMYVPKLYNGRNKTFFFYSWESNVWGKPTTTVGTVPTPAERNGDFSALLALNATSYQIYDPFTTTAAANGRYTRRPFAGNLIPANRIDPVSKAILGYYPPPNTPGTSTGQNNYTRNTKDTFDYYVHFLRFDQNFSDKNRMFVRVDWDRYLESNSNFYNNIANGLNLTRKNRGAAVDEVLVLSHSSILNLRYGLTQEETPERRRSAGFDLSSLGFSPALLSLLDPRTETFPNVYFNTKPLTSPCSGACTGTYSGFGNFQLGDGTTTGMVHDFAGTFNTLRGSHNQRYGVDFRLYRSFGIDGGYDVSPGLQFLPTYTNGPNDNSAFAPIGQEFASFLLGIPSGQMTRSASYASQNTYLAGFLQDDWKVNAKLTVNAGLRYERESPVGERFDRAVRGFDRTDPNPIAAQAIANYAQNPVPGIPIGQFQVPGGLLFAGPGKHNLWDSGHGTFLPRVGLAYRVDGNTVVRTGYGIFYDTIGVNRTRVIQSGFTATTPIIASYDNGLHYDATTANPFPNGLLPPAGASAGLATYLGQNLAVYPNHRLQPYSQRWTFDIERLLPGQVLLDVGYVGNKAVHLPVSRDLNAIPDRYLSASPTRDPATINSLSAQFANPFYGINSVYPKTIARSDLLRPYPEFGTIVETENNGYSWYHALQVRAERRLSKGFTINAAYTWSKFMDATGYLNAGDANLNRSISQYDRPHWFVVSGIWEVPVGRGRPFGPNLPRALDAIAGGWQLNGLVERQSGGPLGFGDVIFTGNIKEIPLPVDRRTVDRWFDTSGFVRAPGQQLMFDLRTFPKYLAGVRGPGQSQWNFSAIKFFNVTERVKLQFRAECYDALNHPNFNDPNMTVTGSNFGVISGQGSPSRQFQGALKLTF